MNEAKTPPDAELLLRQNELRQKWIENAGRPHTKNLFGFWLLAVVVTLVLIWGLLSHEDAPARLAIVCVVFMPVVLTGAYTFQEVSRIHKRNDAIVKLLEDKVDKG